MARAKKQTTAVAQQAKQFTGMPEQHDDQCEWLAKQLAGKDMGELFDTATCVYSFPDEMDAYWAFVDGFTDRHTASKRQLWSLQHKDSDDAEYVLVFTGMTPLGVLLKIRGCRDLYPLAKREAFITEWQPLLPGCQRLAFESDDTNRCTAEFIDGTVPPIAGGQQVDGVTWQLCILPRPKTRKKPKPK